MRGEQAGAGTLKIKALPGPLEQQAKPVTAENPVPRRSYQVPPDDPFANDPDSFGGRQDQADAGRRRPGGRIPPRSRDDAPEQRSARPRRQPVDDAGSHRVGGKRPGTIRTPGRGPADRDARVRGGPLGRAMAVRGPVPSADVVRGRRHVRDAAAATASTARATSPDLDAAAATTAAGDQLAAGSDRHAAASAPGTGKRAPRDAAAPAASAAGLVRHRHLRSGSGDLRRRVRVGGEIKPPTKIKNVNAVYPPDAMEQKVQGVVILEARIEPDGTVSRTRVLRSIPMLDDAAKEAVGQWTFTPTLLNGQAVAAGDDGYGELHVAVDKSQSNSKLQRTPNHQLPSQLPTGS